MHNCDAYHNESVLPCLQYAEIDHRGGRRSKKPKDKDLVLYSELKVDEVS